MTFHPTFRTNVYLEMQLSGKAPSNSFEFHLQLWKNQKKKKNKKKQKIIQTAALLTFSILKTKNEKQKKKNLTSKQNTATSLTNEI